MQCADLERYLEAFLDGRLGRSRAMVLRRHVAVCLPCRSRLEKLKQFERDLNRRLRTMEHVESVWSGLELDLVKSTQEALPSRIPSLRLLPPPPQGRSGLPQAATRRTSSPRTRRTGSSRRRIATRLVGVMLVVAAAGAVYEIAVRRLSGGGTEAIQAYLAYVEGDRALELATAEPASLQNWFSARLGLTFPEPPAPEGFAIVGGRLGEIAGGRAAVVVYAKGEATALLYMRPHDAPPAVPPSTVTGQSEAQGVTHLSWQQQGFDYELVSPLPAEELKGFAGAAL